MKQANRPNLRLISHLLMVAVFFAGISVVSAQQITRSVIGTASLDTTTKGFAIDATVGEVFVATAITDTIQLTQGFQQPDELWVSGIKQPNTQTIQVSAFPNPAMNYFYVQAHGTDNTNLQLEIYDTWGRKITPGTTPNGNMVKVDATTLASGVYFMKLTNDKGSPMASFSIVITK